MKLEQRLDLYETGQFLWDIEMVVEEPLSDDEAGASHSVSESESESESEVLSREGVSRVIHTQFTSKCNSLKLQTTTVSSTPTTGSITVSTLTRVDHGFYVNKYFMSFPTSGGLK